MTAFFHILRRMIRVQQGQLLPDKVLELELVSKHLLHRDQVLHNEMSAFLVLISFKNICFKLSFLKLFLFRWPTHVLSFPNSRILFVLRKRQAQYSKIVHHKTFETEITKALYIYMLAYMHVYMFTYTHICIFVHIYMYICIYT